MSTAIEELFVVEFTVTPVFPAKSSKSIVKLIFPSISLGLIVYFTLYDKASPVGFIVNPLKVVVPISIVTIGVAFSNSGAVKLSVISSP